MKNAQNAGKEVVAAATNKGENKEVIAKAPEAAAPATVAQPAVVVHVSKAEISRQVFAEMHKDGAKPQRKDVIKAISDRAKISEKGAATYYQNAKEKAGMVQKKVPATAAPASVPATA